MARRLGCGVPSVSVLRALPYTSGVYVGNGMRVLLSDGTAAGTALLLPRRLVARDIDMVAA